MAPDANDDGNQKLKERTQRSRWATRRLTVKSSSLKRLAVLNRTHKKSPSNEKNRMSGGGESLRVDGTQELDDSSQSGEGNGSRKLYFNLELPSELLDEEGNPTQQFTRNKIRTAKYTPLSFIPKNLWFQFHNIANIFFLFLVILVVS
jgi:phospholipid-translocating ATPase